MNQHAWVKPYRARSKNEMRRVSIASRNSCYQAEVSRTWRIGYIEIKHKIEYELRIVSPSLSDRDCMLLVSNKMMRLILKIVGYGAAQVS